MVQTYYSIKSCRVWLFLYDSFSTYLSFDCILVCWYVIRNAHIRTLEVIQQSCWCWFWRPLLTLLSLLVTLAQLAYNAFHFSLKRKSGCTFMFLNVATLSYVHMSKAFQKYSKFCLINRDLNEHCSLLLTFNLASQNL